MRKINVGVVGATGMVGQSFIQSMTEEKFPVGELRLFASDASIGKKIKFLNQDISVLGLAPDCFKGLDLVFFSSGDDISLEWAPIAVKSGAWAVDNSAAFRMNPSIDLVVPEVNGDLLKKDSKPKIIANPNCSTIQLVVALKPLFEKYGIDAVKVASYQAVSGAGLAAYEELQSQMRSFSKGEPLKKEAFPHQIGFNVIPQIGSFSESGFSTEENKIMKETKKILGSDKIKVSAFTVRVPVLNAHSEAVWVTLKTEARHNELVQCMKNQEGLIVSEGSEYPMPLHVSGKSPVYVGRIHQDGDDPMTWLFWVVSDNIKKGASLNGIQIAQRIFDI